MLTEQQREIVLAEDKKSIVLASAGSGKTFVLTHKIEHLIKEKEINPSNIFVFSFSRSATREIRERLAKNLTTAQYDKLYISTFHSFCYSILQEYNSYAGISKNMNILSNDQLKGIIKNSINYLANNGSISDRFDAEEALPYYFNIRWGWPLSEEISKPKYDIKKTLDNTITYLDKINSYTFNDLIILCIQMMEKYPSVTEEIQNKFDVLILDECQDTQVIVTCMLNLLITERHNFCIVGDVCQTLYRFNNSDPFKLLELANRWNSKIFYLNETFRFGETISCIANNICEDMEIEDRYKIPTKTNQTSEPTTFIIGEDIDRFEYVSNQIKALYAKGIPYENIYVLSRVNSQLGKYAKLLMEQGIPAVLKGGNLLLRKEVNFVFAIIKCFHKVNVTCLTTIFENYNVGYDNILLSKLFDDFTGNTIFQLVEHVNCNKIRDIGEERKKAFLGVARSILNCYPFLELKRNVFMQIADTMDMKSFKFMNHKDETGTGNDERFEILNLLDEIFSSQFKGDIYNFENYMKVTFASDTETKSKAVSLLTVHSSKGMSLPYVFLDTSKFGTFDGYNLLDEQFCLYVGVTRAKYKIWYLSDNKNVFNVYMNDDTEVISIYNDDGVYIPSEKSKETRIAELKEVKTEVNFSSLCLGSASKCNMMILEPKSIIKVSEKAVMLNFGSKDLTQWIPKSNIRYDKNSNHYFASSWWIGQGNSKYLKTK